MFHPTEVKSGSSLAFDVTVPLKGRWTLLYRYPVSWSFLSRWGWVQKLRALTPRWWYLNRIAPFSLNAGVWRMEWTQGVGSPAPGAFWWEESRPFRSDPSRDCFDLWLEMALPETPGEFGSQSKQVGVSSSSNSVPPSENNMEAKFLGNAPCGHYKFKFPQAMRTETILGAKVFFFKALLLTGDFSEAGKKDRHVWVSKEELGDYLKPKYLAQVRRFLLDLWWTELPVDNARTGLRLGPQWRFVVPPSL